MIFVKILQISHCSVINSLHSKIQHSSSKAGYEKGSLLLKTSKLLNGKLDVNYLNETLIDQRQLHSQVNMLQKSFFRAKITASIDLTRDTSIPVYVHHTNEIYTWEQKRAKYYYNHLIQEIVTPPTLELYWRNFTNLRITEDLLSKSYMSKLKLIKDKKLAETYLKILNNLLPCNKNLHKWGKSDTKLCNFVVKKKVLVICCITVGMLSLYGRLWIVQYRNVTYLMIWSSLLLI